jgi:AraC-like DNA-binding protein
MNTLLIIGTFESVFLILLLLGKNNKSKADLFLGFIFFFYALSIGTTYLEGYNFNNGFPFPAIINISWLLLFLHGPALWLYIKSLTDQDFRLKPIHLLHLVPFIVYFSIHYYTFMALPAQDKIELVRNDLFKQNIFYTISVVSIGISTIGYNIWALLLIRDHRKNIMKNFSQIEGIDLNWLRILTISSLVCYSVNVFLFNLDLIFQYATYQLLMLVTYSFASVYILFLGYFGIQQGNIFINKLAGFQSIDPVQKPEERVSTITDVFTDALLQFMEHKQPYLDPEITLAKLSDLMEVRPEYLSEILNSQLNQNFFDFINKYRVEEFKIQSLVKSNSHLSILGIAHQCGFNSKAAFYRAFKKFEDISPSAYIQQVSQKSGTTAMAK